MRTIVHLSDLHFGTVAPALVAALTRTVAEQKPDLVVVSGDLTQRARHSEFKAARAFLDSLAAPQVVVAGNHDVPLYNVVKRFLYPLTRFRTHITPDLMPVFADDELLVVGMTSARSFTISGGRLSKDALEALKLRLSGIKARENVVRILACHHPLSRLDTLGFEVLLSGHLHDPTSAADHVLRVSAGTATSSRVRHGEPNSFNILRVARPTIEVERHDWSESKGTFVTHSTERFRHEPGGWVAAGKPIT